MDETTASAFALVGPGRAGTAVADGLVAAGHRCVAVAGRSPDAPSTRAAAARYDAAATTVADAGRQAQLVVIATPDAALDATAATLVGGLRPGGLVVHLSGARGLDALAPIAATRPDVSVGALHPLQTFVEPTRDRVVLAGAWAAISGPPAVRRVAHDLGLRPVEVPDERRAEYHAAAVVASNHLVALLGQVERLADHAGVPLAAFEPLVRATVDHVFDLGPAAALTGPVARGDIATVSRHLAVIADDEHRAYQALADSARRLAGRDDAAWREVLA
jgi:predicted short-subunit dehydrogenase-like oxidoreductase (DUF2520 family)